MPNSVPPSGAGNKLKKAIAAFSEMCQAHPEKKRQDMLSDIQFRFDLSPRECEFLDSHFCEELKEDASDSQ